MDNRNGFTESIPNFTNLSYYKVKFNIGAMILN